jgi:hypothetical protein
VELFNSIQLLDLSIQSTIHEYQSIQAPPCFVYLCKFRGVLVKQYLAVDDPSAVMFYKVQNVDPRGPHNPAPPTPA